MVQCGLHSTVSLNETGLVMDKTESGAAAQFCTERLMSMALKKEWMKS